MMGDLSKPLDTTENLFIRACKVPNRHARLERLYRRHYLGEIDNQYYYNMCQILQALLFKIYGGAIDGRTHTELMEHTTTRRYMVAPFVELKDESREDWILNMSHWQAYYYAIVNKIGLTFMGDMPVEGFVSPVRFRREVA